MTLHSENHTTKPKIVVVLGAGVEGLTTALKIKEKWGDGVEVEIIADILPADPKSVMYTSHWAGAHYVCSSPTGTREGDLAHATFREMWELSAPGTVSEEYFLRLPQTELYAEGSLEMGPEREVNPFEVMPEFHELTKTELSQFPGVKAVSGYSFETVTIDVPVYLRYLMDRAAEKGVKFVRGHVQHINQVIEGGSGVFKEDVDHKSITPPDAVIVCVGLGARSLGGVEDADVYPSRGQTVILRTPWVRFGRTLEDEVNNEWTYIIPRRSGDVIVGGVQGVGDWYPKPRPETTRDLLERGFKLCPELMPPEKRSNGGSGGVDDLFPLIVEQGCGFRPMRKGGPRIDLEYMNVPGATQIVGGEAKERKVAVVHNYGHGARGYILSIGSAELVVSLLGGSEAFMP